MVENIIYDIAIIGASSEAIDIVKQLNKKNKKLNKKILFISSDFDKLEIEEPFEHIILERNTVTYLSYNHGLLHIDLADSQHIVALRALISTGSVSALRDFEQDERILRKLPIEPVDNEQILIFGTSDDEIKTAIKATDKYHQVYVCDSTNYLKCSEDLKNEFEQVCTEKRNLVFLPGLQAVGYKYWNEGRFRNEIKFSNGTNIRVDAVYIRNKLKANTAWIATGLANYTEEGLIEYSKDFRLGALPNVFAVGTGVSKNLKTDRPKIVKALLEE